MAWLNVEQSAPTAFDQYIILFRTSEDGQGVRGFATKISEVKEETEFQKRLPEGWVNLLQECLLKGLPITHLE